MRALGREVRRKEYSVLLAEKGDELLTRLFEATDLAILAGVSEILHTALEEAVRDRYDCIMDEMHDYTMVP